MALAHYLTNAPIREALLDIRVELPAEFSAAAFKSLRNAVGPAYPKMTEGSKVEASIQFDPSGKLSSESVDLGLHAVLFWAADEKTVAQFRVDGFTLNKLRPYTRWDSIFPEAMRLWALFSAAATPSGVSGIGLRYINEFSIPGPLDSIGRYLQSVPAAPRGALGRMKGFLTRINTQDDASLTSTVTHSVDEYSDGSQVRVVLDVDVTSGAITGTTPDDLSPPLARLRTAKNDIFFESLTKEALALFQ